MPARAAGHREHFAIEKLALKFRLALDLKILPLAQAMNWFC
jgi:hypothetical protein